jgi:hypothetical protein
VQQKRSVWQTSKVSGADPMIGHASNLSGRASEFSI